MEVRSSGRCAPLSLPPETDLGQVVGHAGPDAPGRALTLSLSPRLRSMHAYIRGVSGTGKTQGILVPMVMHDVLTGQPLLAMDPVGTFVPLLTQLIAAENRRLAMRGQTQVALLRQVRRSERERFCQGIIVLDFSDEDVGGWRWNPLELAGDLSAHETADGFISCLQRIVGDMVEMRRLQTILKATLTCLIELGALGAPVTLRDLLDFLVADADSIEHFIRILQQKRAGGKLRVEVRPTLIEAYLGHFFAQTGGRERRELVQSTWNCISLVLSDPKLDRFFCGSARSNLCFSQIVNEGRALLVNLPSGLGMNTKAVASAAIINRIEMTCQRRKDEDVKAGRVPPFTIYCDEFQECFTRQWMESIATCRNKALRLVVAHQAATQFVGEEGQQMLRAFMANCATQVYFRCSWDDAREVAGPIFRPTGNRQKRRTTQITQTQSVTDSVSRQVTAQISESESQLRGSTRTLSLGDGRSVSLSEAKGVSRVESDSVTLTRGHGWARAVSKSSGSSITVSEAEGSGQAEGQAHGTSHSEGTSDQRGMNAAVFKNDGVSIDLHAQQYAADRSNRGEGKSGGESSSTGRSMADAISKVFSSVQSLTKSEGRASGLSRGKGISKTKSGSESEGRAHAVAQGLSSVSAIIEGVSSSITRATGEQESRSRTHAQSWSTSEAQSRSHGLSRAVSERVEYYSVQEEIVQHANELSCLPPRTAWVIVNDAKTATYKIVTHDMPQNVKTTLAGVDYC